jgi:hypothetical protein
MMSGMVRMKTGALWVVVGIAAFAALKRRRQLSSIVPTSLLTRIFVDLTHAVDLAVGWEKLPVPLGLLTLIGLRIRLRQKNLYSTSPAEIPRTAVVPLGTPSAVISDPAPTDPAATGEVGARYLTARTADGTFNDLAQPLMGSAGTRFGRNVPLEYTYPDEQAILVPNPRAISLELLTRKSFQPATTLNLVAASWLQFMIRDWLSHGNGDGDKPWEVPLPAGDTWPEPAVRIPRTMADPTRQPSEANLPPTHINTETHWWDGSQIYGSNKQVQDMVRSGEGGKLKVDSNGLPAIHSGALNLPGFWIGMAMMHTLFTLEHNAICDRLRAEYPSWSDDELFDHARLINAALMAKIHTVDWTPAIISHPTTTYALRANWWGIEMEKLHKLVGRIADSEVLSGIPGSQTDHYGVPYSLTEEFVAVYKMHPLIPDDYSFRSIADDGVLQECTFPDVAQQNTINVVEKVPMTDLFYSFGTMHPGAITLHNYPAGLQHFLRPDGYVTDLASTDILRAREMGVPRYTQFRKLLGLRVLESFEELSDNPVWVEEIRRVYNNDLDRVDLMIGLYAEPKPQGFGFSDTAFRIFILMASRRLNSDRFFTVDYTPTVYTPAGMEWIDNNNMTTVLLRHFPGLAPALRGVENAFAPWARTR